MCGRFVFSSDALEAAREIAYIPEYIQEQLEFTQIVPSRKSLILKAGSNGLEGGIAPFGFMSEYLGKRIFNARAQGIESKWMFRNALRRHRILIPCSGFFEWSPAKVKTYFFREHTPVLYMAGILVDDGFVIITTEANPSVADIHPRMPLILPVEKAKEWVLDPQETGELLHYEPAALSRESDTPLTLF